MGGHSTTHMCDGRHSELQGKGGHGVAVVDVIFAGEYSLALVCRSAVSRDESIHGGVKVEVRRVKNGRKEKSLS